MTQLSHDTSLWYLSKFRSLSKILMHLVWVVAVLLCMNEMMTSWIFPCSFSQHSRTLPADRLLSKDMPLLATGWHSQAKLLLQRVHLTTLQVVLAHLHYTIMFINYTMPWPNPRTSINNGWREAGTQSLKWHTHFYTTKKPMVNQLYMHHGDNCRKKDENTLTK